MVDQAQGTASPTAAWRWSVLIAVSVAMFGNYYVYDAIAPVADLLQRHLGFTDTQLGTLNAIYSFPNIIAVFVGGVIVDRFGTRLATLGFSLICGVGAVVTAMSPAFPAAGSMSAAGSRLCGLPPALPPSASPRASFTTCSNAVQRADSSWRSRHGPIASCGPTSGASIGPTGTSSACA
jgi:MFS family permease